MLVDKVHEIISYEQSEWLGRYTDFITQKRNQAIKNSVIDF